VHELYSLRVVDHLIGYGKGLNLTYAVRDGIVSHCGEKFEQSIIPVQEIKDLGSLTGRNHLPSTWEGAVVRMADKIAYLGRDLEDALQLKIVKRGDVPEEIVTSLGAENGVIINTLVNDLIDTSRKNGAIAFSDEKYHAMKVLTEFNYRNIYRNPLLSDYHRYFDRILRSLFDYLEDLFDRYRFDETQYRREKNLLAVRFGDYVCKMRSFYEGEDGGFRNLAVDYVAGMTDDYALECIQEIMLPQKMETQFDQFLLGN
jgi:dGTPase